MDYDYNTSRGKLILPEYGRNIQHLVEFIRTVEDRDERNRVARAVIGIMGNMNPHLRDISDFKHKLWDHLFIMADFDLDIDSPYEVPTHLSMNQLPKVVPYGTHRIRYKHYGWVIEQLIQAAIDYPEGEEKEHLIRTIANQMKKSYLTWNREVVSDEIIFEDLQQLSKGKISVKDGLKLHDSREILAKNKRKRTARKGKF